MTTLDEIIKRNIESKKMLEFEQEIEKLKERVDYLEKKDRYKRKK